jgi:hypothetical protein
MGATASTAVWLTTGVHLGAPSSTEVHWGTRGEGEKRSRSAGREAGAGGWYPIGMAAYPFRLITTLGPYVQHTQ